MMDAGFLAELFRAVGAHLAGGGTQATVVAVGGAALALRGWVARATYDVDVLAMETEEGGELRLGPPEFPAELEDAIARVARDYGLAPDWFNAEVGAQWITGLPEGVEAELEWREFGALRVGLAGRRTLIALKLHAAADCGRDSKHSQDLVALKPDEAELRSAAAWVVQQDGLP